MGNCLTYFLCFIYLGIEALIWHPPYLIGITKVEIEQGWCIVDEAPYERLFYTGTRWGIMNKVCTLTGNVANLGCFAGGYRFWGLGCWE
jgi:hypothetical protein